MSEPHFSRPPGAGQSGRHVRAFLCALAVLVAGCTSIYHRARSDLPAQMEDAVQQRLAEARQAAAESRSAASRLQNHLRQGKPAALLATDFDRLELTGHELERRALAARDLLEKEAAPANASAEVESLLQAALTWLGYVNSNRGADTATQRRELDALLVAGPTGPVVRD